MEDTSESKREIPKSSKEEDLSWEGEALDSTPLTVFLWKQILPLASSLAKFGDMGLLPIHKDSWYCAGAIWLLFLIASFARDFMTIPLTYFANRRNVLNVYFVKIGWGWTIGTALVYFTCVTAINYVKSKRVNYNPYGRLLFATVIWYIATTSFEMLERLTGGCQVSTITDQVSCEKSGHIWSGFDVSGHTYMLTFLILIINEELHDIKVLYEYIINKYPSVPVQKPNKSSETPYDYLLFLTCELAAFVLVVLQYLWLFMLFWTCLYFHTVTQKLLGLLFGLTSWYLCYEYVFISIDQLRLGSCNRMITLDYDKM